MFGFIVILYHVLLFILWLSLSVHVSYTCDVMFSSCLPFCMYVLLFFFQAPAKQLHILQLLMLIRHMYSENKEFVLYCIGVVIVLILNSDLESKKEMRNDDDNYL